MLDHTGSATYADNVEIVVGDGASLTLVSVNDWADDAVHLSQQSIKVGRDAKLKSIVITFGGNVVRIAPEARFAAPGGDVEMLGLYFADAGQHLEHRLFVDHAVPQLPVERDLQGRDAGRGGAHGLDRRRADPAPRPWAPTRSSSTATCC